MRSQRDAWHFACVIAISAVLVAAACGPAPLSSSETYRPPAPLALVALVDPSTGNLAQELRQLEDVVRADVSPGETVVVMMLQPSFGQVYVVRQGDNLSSIATAHGLTLAQLEAGNAQLGPVAGRSWMLIHPGERVMIPDGAAGDALLLVTRAPSGPAPPQLVRLPQALHNPTDYQRAQYQHTVANDDATNAARIADWQARAKTTLAPWQQQVVAELDQKTAARVAAYRSPDSQVLSASITAGVTTLNGLSGRRLLLLLGGGDSGPATLAPGSLADVKLVVANLTDPRATAGWTSAATTAGAAAVATLDTALTQLQLAATVNQ